VEILRPADEAHGGQPVAVAAHRGVGRLEHPRVGREPQVVVGAEDQHPPAVRQRHLRSLGRGEHTLLLVETALADAGDLVVDLLQPLGVHGSLDAALCPQGTSTTLPAWPDWSSAIASWKRSIGMTCVIAGRTSSRPDWSRLSIWYQVSYMRRPMMPWIVTPLKITSRFQSSSNGSLGRPSSESRPPLRSASSPSRMACGLPDISSTPSTPRPCVSAMTRSGTLSREASMTASAFMRRARSRR